jgi:hypothetical protein
MSGKKKIEHAASDRVKLNEPILNARRKVTELIRIAAKVQEFAGGFHGFVWHRGFAAIRQRYRWLCGQILHSPFFKGNGKSPFVKGDLGGFVFFNVFDENRSLQRIA